MGASTVGVALAGVGSFLAAVVVGVFIVVGGRGNESRVSQRARRLGAGQALIASCEAWAKGRGIGVIMIGVLGNNTRAHGIYNTAGYADYSLQLRKYL